MLKYIDDKLDLYFEKGSSTYMDKKIWNDIFSYLDSIKEEDPEAHFHEVKRCRDLKNSIDYAYEEGVRIGRIDRAKRLIKEGFNNPTISELTKLSIEEVEKLRKTDH